MSHKIRFVVAFLAAIFLTAVSLNAGNMMAKDEKANETIVAIASDNSDFSTLVTALKEADLVSVLKGQGPFTVFAPNNEAFAKLGDATLNDLLKPENKEKLRNILLFHVVPGKVTSDQIKDMDVAAVNGDTLEIRVVDGKVMVDGKEVIKPDIEASNGVIHVINGVLVPKN